MARELDETLWSQLRREILEECILQYLPFSARCRFRAVCKGWNTKLAIHPEEPHLLDIPCNSTREDQLQFCYLYSPVRNIWSQIDLSFVIANMYQLGYPSSWKPQIKTYCSDGGLLCVWGEFLGPRGSGAPNRHSHVLVCNPITRSCKRIGCRWDGNSFELRDLTMHKDTSGGYKIFAATFDRASKYLTYFVYDSVPQYWNMAYADSRGDQYVYCSIVFNGVFYFWVKESCDDWKNAGVSLERQVELFACDISQDYISQDYRRFSLTRILKIKPHPTSETNMSFVVKDGHLLLILAANSCFSINKVDLSNPTATLDASACYAPLPKQFSWISSATFEHENSIIFASDDDGERREGIHLFSWSTNLDELQPITPVLNRPRLGYHWRYYRKNMKKVTFDMKAII